MDRIRVGVIGAGETGTPLIAQLLTAAFVEVVGVADLDREAPGMVIAHAAGRPVTDDFMTLADLGEGVDIIIDVTGVPEVRDRLRQRLQETGNRHTVIMHEVIARLMTSLSQGRLADAKHGIVDYDGVAGIV